MRILLSLLLVVAAAVAQPTQTTITDTLYNPASNTLLEGYIRIELMVNGATSNQAHVFGERTVTVTGGALSLTLPPNSTMSPSGSYYRATKQLRAAGTTEKYRVATVTWTVPTSASCSGGVCKLADIESTTAPTPSGTVNISRLTSACSAGQTIAWNGFTFACNSSATNPMSAIGDVIYGDATGTMTRLSGNTSTTPKFLKSTGSGSAATAPAWTQAAASDLSNGTTGSGNVVLATGPTITGATISGSLTGNASTATALAANGSNCSAGQFPLGVDASGAAESCTALPTTIAGTANQITASASTGAITLSLPSTITGLTSVTSTAFVGALTGNASTAAALAANPADCSANQYATTIAANGDLTCAQPAASNLSNGTTGSGSIVLASSPTIVTPTIASFANATHNHQAAAGGGTLAGASALSDYSTAFVTSITGTANQVTASASVGGVTLSLPQSIHTGASPTFAGLTSPSLTYAGTLALSATGSNVITLSTNSVARISVAATGATTFIPGSDGGDAIRIDRAASNNAGYLKWSIGGTEQAAIRGFYDAGSDKQILALYVGNLVTERARITSGGNALFGSTVDDANSRVQIDGGARPLAIYQSTVASGSDTYFVLGKASATNQSAAMVYKYNSTAASQQIRFSFFGGLEPIIAYGTGNVALASSGTGNVLIGTTTDDGSSKLQVAGKISLSNNLAFSDAGTVPSDATATLFNQSGVGPTISGLNIQFRTGATPASMMSLSNAGTLTLYNTVATTGVTSAIIRAGAGQSTNILFQLQDNSANVFMKAYASNGSIYFQAPGVASSEAYMLPGSGVFEFGGNTGVALKLTANAQERLRLNATGVGFFGATPVAKAAALTAANASALNTGDATSDAVIGNMRTRIAELESKLQAYGLLN